MYRCQFYSCEFVILGRYSQWANQQSDTYNLIFGGVAMIVIRDESGKVWYQEESLDCDSEKPLFLQPGKKHLLLRH